MNKSKSREHRIDFYAPSCVSRKGVRFHMSIETWNYGYNHALPLWTEFVIYPAILPRGYKYSQTNMIMTSFELVLEGSMVIVQDDTRLITRPGELCLFPAGKNKVLEVKEECRKVVFGISGPLHLSLLAMTGILSRSVIRIEHTEQILAILRELHGLLKEKAENSVPKISALTMELVMEISREAGRTPEPQLADALRFLEYNLSEPIQLSVLAEKLHVTTDYLNRLFLKELGIPPKRYLIEQRMQLASSLLESSKLTILEISQKCGYKTQFAFSKEFRKKFGISPLRYRETVLIKKKI